MATLRLSWVSDRVCYIPAEECEARLPSLGTRESNDARYSRYSTDELIAGYRTRARTSEPGMQALIEYAVADERDFILEGFHIEPDFARRMATTYGETRIKAVFLYKEDVEDIAVGLKLGDRPNDWVCRNTREDATFRAIAVMINQYSRVICAEAEAHRLPTFNMDRYFRGQIAAVLHHLQD